MMLSTRLATLLALSTLAPAAPAVETIGTYFDAAGTQTSTSVAVQEMFDIYFIADNVPLGVGAYEFYVNMPPELLILSVTAHPVGSALDFDSSMEGFYVGTGVCLNGPGPIVLAEFTCMALAPASNLEITLSPAPISSFGGTATGYAACVTFDLYPFVNAYSGPATVDVGLGGAFCLGDGTEGLCPCGNGTAVGLGEGCANGTGSGAYLSSSGSASVSMDTLMLRVEQAVPNEFGIFVQNVSTASPGLPFYNGLLCLSTDAHLVRHYAPPSILPTVCDAAGTGVNAQAMTAGDFLGDTTPGYSTYYQFWYRDNAGPCGSGANFSAGVAVQWTF